jgi:hypothetical protein
MDILVRQCRNFTFIKQDDIKNAPTEYRAVVVPSYDEDEICSQCGEMVIVYWEHIVNNKMMPTQAVYSAVHVRNLINEGEWIILSGTSDKPSFTIR